MAVPALVTTNIGMFAWYRQSGCTQVTLADCLGVLHSYDQYSEYVDGTIKIFDTGSESAAPDNYVLINVRVRKDGYILAWFARELTPSANQTVESATATVITMSTTKCQIQNYHDSTSRDIVADELAGNILEFTSGALNGQKITIQSNTTTTITLHSKYGDDVSTDVSGEANETFRIYSSRGNLVWWGHTSSAAGNPTDQSTRLGRALYEIWEQLKANQIGGSGASLDYNDVNYYDYEYTSATHLYIFGYSHTINVVADTTDKYFYFTIPSGITTYDCTLNHGGRVKVNCCVWSASILMQFNGVTFLYRIVSAGGDYSTNGFRNVQKNITDGIQNTIRIYSTTPQGGPQTKSASAIILTNG